MPSAIRDALLNRIYQRAPVMDERVRSSYRDLVRGVEEQYAALPIHVEFTKADAYGTSSKKMFEDIDNNGRLKVWTGASEHPILTPMQNWKFRAVHDYYGHYEPGNTFSRSGERAAYEAHARMFPPSARAALASETEAQQAVYRTTGRFAAEQKAVYIPGWLR